MNDETAMVKAHKAGIKAFHDGNAGASMARTLAHKLYTTKEERECFIAGYLMTMQRDLNKESGYD